ncbi:hypothetical protein D3C81_1438030 [compost metagenome]
MRMVPSTGWRREPKLELSRANWIGERMKLFFSGRPLRSKYSDLPLRSKRKPVYVLPPVVNVAASTLLVSMRSPSRQVSSITTLKRSPCFRSLEKSMSYLKMSSVIVAMAEGDRPALRAAA